MPAQRTDREPVVLVDGVTPETVIDAILDAIDVAYREDRELRRPSGTARVSLPAHFVDWLYQHVNAAALTRAREAGAEAMRERAATNAAQVIERLGYGNDTRRLSVAAASAIRALPLTEATPDEH